MIGTLLNIATVLVGGGLGTLLGNRLPERMRDTVLHGIGLVTLLVGLQMALKTGNILVVMGSILLGAILGEWVGASRGLGVFMLRATSSFRTDWVFVTIVIVAALSMTLFGLVTLAERIVLYWYYAAMRTEDWKEVRRSK